MLPPPSATLVVKLVLAVSVNFFTPSTHTSMRARLPVIVDAACTVTGEVVVPLFAGWHTCTPGEVGAEHLPAVPTVNGHESFCRRLSKSDSNIVALCVPAEKLVVRSNRARCPHAWYCSPIFVPSTHSSILRIWPKLLAAALKQTGDVTVPAGEQTPIAEPRDGYAQLGKEPVVWFSATIVARPEPSGCLAGSRMSGLLSRCRSTRIGVGGATPYDRPAHSAL
jgi:hypothetical protein